MIIDRTQQDVELALEIREKVKNGETLTESEILSFERGFLTVNTLNRIEEKQAELSQILSDLGYSVSINTKQWDSTQIFDILECERWIFNLQSLKSAFFTSKTTPDVPVYLYGYREMNAVEKILVDLEELTNNTISSFAYSSSEIYSGGIS